MRGEIAARSESLSHICARHDVGREERGWGSGALPFHSNECRILAVDARYTPSTPDDSLQDAPAKPIPSVEFVARHRWWRIGGVCGHRHGTKLSRPRPGPDSEARNKRTVSSVELYIQRRARRRVLTLEPVLSPQSTCLQRVLPQRLAHTINRQNRVREGPVDSAQTSASLIRIASSFGLRRQWRRRTTISWSWEVSSVPR